MCRTWVSEIHILLTVIFKHRWWNIHITTGVSWIHLKRWLQQMTCLMSLLLDWDILCYTWKMTKQYDSFITDVCALQQEAENETWMYPETVWGHLYKQPIKAPFRHEQRSFENIVLLTEVGDSRLSAKHALVKVQNSELEADLNRWKKKCAADTC